MKDYFPSTQPPLKRRRLARNRPSSTTSAKVLTPTNTNKLPTIAIPICSSCHRAFNMILNDTVQCCARCLSIICAVCSRTCTASAASQPPTPHLTWSPTPSPSPAGDSPRRSALAINSPNTNILDTPLTLTSNSTAGKRRKVVDQDDITCTRDGEERDEFGPGCGRLLCRNCCFENSQNNTTTCFDCYGS